MNIGFQNMKRAGLIVAAALVLLPTGAAAQESLAEPINVARKGILVEPSSPAGLPTADTQTTIRRNPDSELPNPSSVWKQQNEFSQSTLPDSAGNSSSRLFIQDSRAFDSGSFWGSADYEDDPLDDVMGRPVFGPDIVFRLGYWGVQSKGSPVKVGEYQDLQSSLFWDFDGIWTNGSQTLDFTLTGLDPEANDVRGYYYGGPGLTVNLDYERFLRRLDHVPLAGFDLNSGVPGPADKVVTDDLNVGEDYAIRVQRLEADFKGQLTNNLKWKVNLWGMRKSGVRQANAVAHCFNINPPGGAANYTCHVLSQRQNIDWTTMEIEPALEAQIGNSVVEYSRTMRTFGQSDQVVDRTYTAFNYSPAFGSQGPPFDYAWVPETFTQVDRLKLNVPIDDANQIYANLYLGNTENQFRGSRRNFNGYDVRLTNRAFDDVTLTAYAKGDGQNNALPTNLLIAPPFGINSGAAGSFEPGSLRQPVEYNGMRYGLKGQWQSRAKSWLSVVGGYELFELDRTFAEYNTLSGPFSQEDTQTHLINIGPYMRVSSTLDTFVRYKAGITNDPLIGVRESDGRFNSSQPEQEHRVEFGGTWSPTSNFMATGLFGFEKSWHDSQYANFDEDNYPIVLTVWYAPTARFSLTGGYAWLSNWIDQDVTIGFRNNPTETTTWNYGGYNNLFSINANYACSPRAQLVGGLEWDRGSNTFSVPLSPAGADWAALPTFSNTIVETTRVNLGVDYEFGPSINGYFRYVHFDFDDLSMDFNSGTADMLLAGVTWIH